LALLCVLKLNKSLVSFWKKAFPAVEIRIYSSDFPISLNTIFLFRLKIAIIHSKNSKIALVE